MPPEMSYVSFLRDHNAVGDFCSCNGFQHYATIHGFRV